MCCSARMNRRYQVNTPKKHARYATTIQYSISSETIFCFQPSFMKCPASVDPRSLLLTGGSKHVAAAGHGRPTPNGGSSAGRLPRRGLLALERAVLPVTLGQRHLIRHADEPIELGERHV